MFVVLIYPITFRSFEELVEELFENIDGARSMSLKPRNSKL